MNLYFLGIYILSFFVEGWSWSTLIGYVLSGMKYFRIFISMLIPEPKGTVESLRGFIKVTYYSDDGDGLKKKYVLLPTSGKEKSWTKVEVVLRTDYREYLEAQHELSSKVTSSPSKSPAELDSKTSRDPALLEPSVEPASVSNAGPSEKSQDEKITVDGKIEKTVEEDLLKDIEAVASGKDTSSRAVRNRKEKVVSTPAKKYKNCPKKDITEEILLLAGANKDFFQVKLTPRDLSSSYQALVFHYNKGQKTFDRDDVLVFV